MADRGEERIGVLGHSFGAYIAIEYAMRHPDRVRFLIIVCGSPAIDFIDEMSATVEARLTPDMRAELELPTPVDDEDWAAGKALPPLYFHAWDPAYSDAFIPHLARAHRMAEVIPNCGVVVMEESGPYPWLEEPDAFFAAVR